MKRKALYKDLGVEIVEDKKLVRDKAESQIKECRKAAVNRRKEIIKHAKEAYKNLIDSEMREIKVDWTFTHKDKTVDLRAYIK